jgi:hypothetical protein
MRMSDFLPCLPGRTSSQRTTPRIRDDDKENITKGHVQFNLSSKETKQPDGPKKARKEKAYANVALVPPIKKTFSNELSTKFSASKGVAELAQRSNEKPRRKPFAPLLPIGQQTGSPLEKVETKCQLGKVPVNLDCKLHLAESEKEKVSCTQQKEDGKSQSHVKRRMWEWEKERERLRALEKLHVREHEPEREEIPSENPRQSTELEDTLEPSRGNAGRFPAIQSAPRSGMSSCVLFCTLF